MPIRPVPTRVYVQHFGDERIASLMIRAFRAEKAKQIAISYLKEKYNVDRSDLDIKIDEGLFNQRILARWEI